MSPADPDRAHVTGAATNRFKSAQFELTATSGAVLLTTGGGSRRRLFVRVVGPTFNPPEFPISLGDQNVTPATGYVLYPLDEIELLVDADTDVYATADLSGTQKTYVSIREEA